MEAKDSFDFLIFMKRFMSDGGVFMWVILCIWITGISLTLYKTIMMRVYDINGNKLFDRVKGYVLNNQVEEAINLCSNSKAVLSNVLKSGLKRANQSKELIEDAISTSILANTPKISYKLSYIQLIANVSTLIGLLGTIQGLILSFAAVAGADPGEKSKLLAEGIAKAMNTTAFGLVSAITIMVAHTILVNKAQKMNDVVDECSSRLADLLSVKKVKVEAK